ncbi:MAG: hypothetical protein IPK64_04990 [bacterium]|nr:hypothetical protein [bacterium]
MPRQPLTRHPLYRLPATLAVVATVVPLMAVSGIARAQFEPAPADSTAFVALPADGAPAPVARTPLEVEVAAIREAFSDRLAELTAAYRAAPDAAAAAGAQRDIAALKAALELDLLDLQLRLARERGDAEALSELEAARDAAGSRLGDVRLPTPATAGSGGREAVR